MEQRFYAEYFEIEDRHWWFVGRREVLMAVLSRRFAARGGELEILDVGCGTGTMLGYLAALGRARGIDADEAAVAFCRARGVEQVQVVPDGEWPFAPESFDLVCALDVIEHIEDDGAALRRMCESLRPRGTLLVTVPALPLLWGDQDEISHHFRRYVRPQLREALAGAGFRILRLTYFNTLLFPPIAAVRLLRRAWRRDGDRQMRSDFTMTDPAGVANRALARVFSWEAGLVTRRDLPVGVSLLALAERPG